MAIKTEHAGAKNGGGFWGPRADAKERSRRLRRWADNACTDDPEYWSTCMECGRQPDECDCQR